MNLLLNAATKDQAFREILENEARTLTSICNDFHIRHFKINRSEITRIEHYDYLFHRLFTLVFLLFFSRDTGNAA